ncbi:VOC family protein [Streptomyces bluensis]|uniref:VOC family protein n=1 Tax=Streptomyces bluensis TaxID=33897 RepID=A0ABW6UM77_9ACTN
MLTTRYVTGAPNWLDLGAPDLDGASSFYGGLFGWQFQPGPPETGGYGFFQLDGKTAAGGMRTTPEQGPPSWTVYFQTPDADATATAVEQAHGTVLAQPMDVLGQGRTALFADRAGVRFGVWQPAATKGLDIVRDQGSLCWLELYTPDLPAAAGFYHAVLGWETSAVAFPGGMYTTVHPAGTEMDAMFGGIVPLEDAPARTETGAWLPYFEVPDTDATAARAQELGGTVRLPATDLQGVGRIAEFTDPYGARFAVIKSVPQQS